MSDYRTAIIPGPIGQLPGFDLSADGYQLAVDDGLETACILSLFADARPRGDEDFPDRNGDRRGWWGDDYAEVPGDVFGSRLWVYERSLATPATLNGIRDAAADALNWLRADGVADRVDVAAEFIRTDGIAYTVTIHRRRDPARRYQFQQFWAGA